MSENLHIGITVQAWADIVIKNWLRRITDLDIGQSGELYESFVVNVINKSGGIPERVEFAHLYYGIFSDMGVGKGVPYGSWGDSNTRRRPKPWRSKQLFAQTAKLSELLATKFSYLGVAVIKENIENIASTGPSKRPGSTSDISELDRAWMLKNGLINR